MKMTIAKDGALKLQKAVTGMIKQPGVKYKWWHAALALVAVTAIGYFQSGTRSTTHKLYQRKNEQAPWAPPAWVFGPAWTINNIFLLWGLLRILNNKDMADRNKLLGLQGGIWVIFLSFGYIYFRKRSPILAEIWTQTDAALATASISTALKSDKKLAIAYTPLLLWTWFASSISAFQALKNPDPLFNTDALLD